MRINFGAVLLFGAMTATQLAAQEAPTALQSHLQVAVTYNPMRSNQINGSTFWLQGGDAQVECRIRRGLGVVADVGGMHAGDINSSGVGFSLVTVTFGPRYTFSAGERKLSVFGEGLIGPAIGFNGFFPSASGSTTNANSLAVQVGGGINHAMSRHLIVRAIEANWLRTQLPNTTTGVQNNLRIGAGIVYRFR